MTFKHLENDLDRYEKAIVEALERNYSYSHERALEIFIQYRKPLRRLDRYENPEDKADSLVSVIKKGRTPEDWLRHINKMVRAETELLIKSSPLLMRRFKQLAQQIHSVQRPVKRKQIPQPRKYSISEPKKHKRVASSEVHPDSTEYDRM